MQNLPATPAIVVTRAAVKGDAERIAQIYTQAILSRESTMDTEPATAQHFERVIAQLAANEALIVCEADGALPGWGIVKRYSDRPGYAYTCETSVYVATEFQRQGCGRALLSAVVDRARSLGYRHLVAKILATNQRSVRFHERFGYEVVGTQRNIGFIDGRAHDIVILQKLFSETDTLGLP